MAQQHYRTPFKKALLHFITDADPIPMRNMKGVSIYYLVFASHNKVGKKVATAIFKKYRTKGFTHGD